MIDNVVQFRQRAPSAEHNAGEAKCIGCGHEWAAAAPAGTVTLECPQCGANRGIWRYPVRAAAGDIAFLCNCGCEALTAYQRAGKFWLRCMACGVDQTEAIFG